jgi:hypothetical protein
MRNVCIAVLGGILFLGCGVNVTSISTARRSGSVKDDFVAEPLVSDVKRYEHALEVSNQFLDALKARDFVACSRHLGPPLDVQIGATQLAAMADMADTNFGGWKEHKPLQWGFTSAPLDGAQFLYSTKIVEHERGRVRYRFVFHDDGKYERIVGIQSRAWKGPLEGGAL